MQLELRNVDVYGEVEPLEVRSDAEKGTWIGGYAARFNSKSKDLGGFVELITPGAFVVSINSNADVRSLVGHNPDWILGRRSNKTLRVWEDEKGLRFESLVPNTSWGRDLLELLKLGTVAGMSFGFRVPEGGDTYAKDGNTVIRTLRQVDLAEVSVVATPAYDTTNVSIRIDPAVISRVRAQEKISTPLLSKARRTLLTSFTEG